MRKATFILISLLNLLYFSGRSQSWSTIGTKGMQNGAYVWTMCSYNTQLCIGGSFDSAANVLDTDIALWNGTVASPMGSGIVNKVVYAVQQYGTNLFAGGAFDTAGGQVAHGIAQWDGAHWSPVDSGTNDIVLAECLYNGKLCVAGLFTVAGAANANNIALWDGSHWQSLGKGIRGFASYVNCVTVYKGNLYACGYFDSAGT